jgi:hypothetical protein
MFYERAVKKNIETKGRIVYGFAKAGQFLSLSLKGLLAFCYLLVSLAMPHVQ